MAKSGTTPEEIVREDEQIVGRGLNLRRS